MGTAQGVSANLGQQRQVFEGISGKMVTLGARFPIVNSLLNAIRRKKSKVRAWPFLGTLPRGCAVARLVGRGWVCMAGQLEWAWVWAVLRPKCCPSELAWAKLVHLLGCYMVRPATSTTSAPPVMTTAALCACRTPSFCLAWWGCARCSYSSTGGTSRIQTAQGRGGGGCKRGAAGRG